MFFIYSSIVIGSVHHATPCTKQFHIYLFQTLANGDHF